MTFSPVARSRFALYGCANLRIITCGRLVTTLIMEAAATAAASAPAGRKPCPLCGKEMSMRPATSPLFLCSCGHAEGFTYIVRRFESALLEKREAKI